MVKTISLGESELIAGITALLGLVAFATGLFVTLHNLCLPVSLAVSYCAALPFMMFRRRFGQLQLRVTARALHFYPNGPLLPSRAFPAESIRSVSELRLADPGPVWAIVVECVDGSRVQIGRFSNPNIHELIAELNGVIRAANRNSSSAAKSGSLPP